MNAVKAVKDMEAGSIAAAVADTGPDGLGPVAGRTDRTPGPAASSPGDVLRQAHSGAPGQGAARVTPAGPARVRRHGRGGPVRTTAAAHPSLAPAPQHSH